jgi:diguanylate cyclase (GGDEF)-like protein/PAS domain S-box-containing protein
MGKVLIAEADPAVGQELSVALRILRHTVLDSVTTGDAAIASAQLNQPELMLLDLRLPGAISGIEAGRRIRDDLDIPVVYLYDECDTLGSAGTTDPFGYLSKPLNIRAVGAAVELALYKYRTERQLKESERWFATTLRCIVDAVITTDEAGQVTFLNQAAEALAGWTQDAAVGQALSSVYQLLDEEPPAPLSCGPRDTAETELGSALQPAWLVARDGTVRPIEESAAPIRDEKDSPIGIVRIFRDITQRREAEQHLEHRALHDALTELPNRTLLQERLQQALLAARRPNTSVALLLMDLDRFKEVNDTFGHHWGDLLLQVVGQRLHGALRAEDTVARLGGDEFAILLPNTDVHGATLVARKVLEVLGAPLVLDGLSLDIQASVGIALYPAHGDDPATLLRHADVAMYLAKRSGSGYALYSAEQDEHSPTRLALMHALRRAIEQEELLLYYQPKVDGRRGTLTGVEALVRWQHPERGLLPPDEFIPLAEYTGLIQPLSLWVLRTALLQCQAWRQMGREVPVAVNLSMQNLQDPELPATIRILLDRAGVPPHWLTVELTESAIMRDPARAMTTLSQLRAMGVQVALDDFGTGYSSLSYVKRLPVTQLKIDKAFVRDAAVDAQDAAILRSVIELSHQLGLAPVAEGVEDQATQEVLASLGCHELQGYHLCRPLPAAELLPWLSAAPQDVPPSLAGAAAGARRVG